MPVDSRHKLYSEHKQDWDQVRHVLAGERVMKEQGELYLPKLSGMTAEEYRRYQKKVHFFGATARVADGLHGAVFSKPPLQSGEMPDDFSESLKDVDLMGTTIDQFASDIVWDCMQTNWGGILVDYAKDAQKVPVSVAEEKGYGAYMKWYPAEYLINWRYAVVNGRERLVLVVLHEPYYEVLTEDMFQEKEYHRYRVLRLEKLPDGGYGRYVQDIWDSKYTLEHPTESGVAVVMNGEYLYDIPFFTVPGKVPEKSMLLDLSFLNIGHFQESADYMNGKHYTSIPTPVALNVRPEEDPVDPTKTKPTYIGGTKFLYFNNETGAPITVKFLEFSGQGMSALRDGINLTEAQMAIMGAHIITAEKKGVESAAVAGIHRAGENGVLGAFIRNVSEQITKAIKLFGKWNNYDENVLQEFDYNLNTDYEINDQDARLLSTLLQGRAAGEFPKIVLYRFLKKIDAIPEDWDLDIFLEETDKDNARLAEPLQLEDDSDTENNDENEAETDPDENGAENED